MPDFDEHVWTEHYAGEYGAEDDEDALAMAYSKGRGGNQYVLNDPDPIQIATGILPQIGQAPLCSVDVPAANARTWTVTLLSMRFGKAAGGVAIVANGTVPLDNQASGFTTTGVQCKLQYGTAEALEEVFFDYPWGGMTFDVSGAMVRLYGPNVAYNSGAVVLPQIGAFISGKNTLADRGPLGSAAFTSTPAFATFPLVTTKIVFPAPRRAAAYRVLEQTFRHAFLAEQVNFTPGTGVPVVIQSDGLVAPNNNAIGIPYTVPSGVVGFQRLHPLASGVQLTGDPTGAAFPANAVVQWLLDIN